MRLSPHFTLAEAAKSHLAARHGIDNTPPAAAIPRLVRVASQILEPVRKEFRLPFSPSSWYRSPDLNAAVGSRPTSAHLTGRAVDFELPGVANRDLAQWCADNLRFDQLILEFPAPGDPASGWVHCALPPDKAGEDANGTAANAPRGEVLTLTRDGYIQGLPA